MLNCDKKPKYNLKAFILMFLLTFILWFASFYIIFFLYFNGKIITLASIILISSSLLMAFFVGILATYNTKREKIKVSFDDRDKFANKINVFLCQYGYTKDIAQDNFFSYKPSYRAGVLTGDIFVSLDEEDAKIDGPSVYLKALENLIRLK